MSPPRRSPPSGSVDTTDDDRTLMEMQRDATEPILLDEDLFDSRPLIDDREPDRKPFGERFAEWRKHYLPLPDEVVDEYLGEDEYVVHTDHPSFRAFLIQNIALVLIVSVVGPAFVILASGGITWTTLLLFLALDVVLLYMAVKRLQDRYVSYVITNLRLIRLSGVFGRRLNSIPWTRMTGLGYFQKPLGRILGYATILIESANEESGLRRFSNINDPATFHQRILDLVSSKTGQSAGGKPPPPTKGVRKSIFQRRRERREVDGPQRAAAPWPTVDDPDAGSDKPGPTDSAKAYEAASPEDDAEPTVSKQPLRPQSAGQRLGGPAGGGPRRSAQAPPSARRRRPAPPGPTDPYGDPAPPAPRREASGPASRRPGSLGTSGGPSVADASPRGQKLPRSGRRPAGDDRPSLIPDYGRNRAEREAGPEPSARESPLPGDAGETGDAGGTPDAGGTAGSESTTAFPPPLTPPRGGARIRPGEPRTPPGGTDAVPTRGPAPTPPPPRPPPRRGPQRRPTPAAGTPAVRPGEPRPPTPPTDRAPGPDPDAGARPPSDDVSPVASGPGTGTDTGAIDRLGEPGTWPDPVDAAETSADAAADARTGGGPVGRDADPERGAAPEAGGDLPGPAIAEPPYDVEDTDLSGGTDLTAGTGRGPSATTAAPAIDEVDDGDAVRPDARSEGLDSPSDLRADEPEPDTGGEIDAGSGDEPLLAGGAPAAEVPEFEPPRPQTPPSSRRMTPPGGTAAVHPGEPREPRPATSTGDAEPAGESSARTEPVVPPRLRRHTPSGGTAAVRPGESRPPRRPEADRPVSPPAGETAPGRGEPRRPWLFGRPRPATGDAAARPRRRFPWFRRELVDDGGSGDGDAHDALETLRPLGSARRRAQAFRRPRFRSFGRNRRSAFPPGRELPPAADDGTGRTGRTGDTPGAGADPDDA